MITPMEIQNHEFRFKWRGYEKEAVRHFLYAIAEDFENLIEQNHKMAQELAILRERVKDMESRDKVLKDTLVTAQQVKTDIHENAEKEAELIIKEAQLKADHVYDEVKQQLDHVRKQLRDIKRVRDDMLAESEMMVSRFSHFVEAERQVAVEADKLHGMILHRKQKQPVKQAADAKRKGRQKPLTIKEIKTGS